MDEKLTIVIVSIIAAVLGYFGKSVHKAFKEEGLRTRDRRACLLKLSCLLKASKVAFDIQKEHRDVLYESLKKRGADASGGYERVFTRSYSSMNSDELVRHTLIRGITVHALYPTNTATRKWLSDDATFRAARHTELSKRLNLLDAHLMLWIAKYEWWIPNIKEHSLVYMGDEDRHGLAFPKGIETLVEKAIDECVTPSFPDWLKSEIVRLGRSEPN